VPSRTWQQDAAPAGRVFVGGGRTDERYGKRWQIHYRGCGILAAMAAGDVQSKISSRARLAVTKVPQITAWFWIAKVASTGMGEATSDFLYFRLGTVKAGAVGAVLLIGALVLQFSVRRYRTWVYWLAVVAVSVTGTQAADGLHVVVGLPYWQTTLLYAVCLAVIFAGWYLTEGTLSIHSITTWRREAFYWATVMATFALGTALGDLTATTFKIGYFKSIVLFAVVIAVPLVAHWKLGMNSVLAFWFAYTITRPLGASLADWLGVAHSQGGLDWGRGKVAAVLTVPILIAVGYMAITGVDRAPGEPQSPARARHRAA
jgi:uncharacterized membrane-anchored protein